MNVNEIKEKIGGLITLNRDICEKCVNEDRALTADEYQQIEEREKRIDALKAAARTQGMFEEIFPRQGRMIPFIPCEQPSDMPREFTYGNRGADGQRWVDPSGREIRAVRRGERLSNPDNGGLSLGNCIRAMLTRDNRHARDEMRALSLGDPASGGFLAPDALFSSVIDLARNRSVLDQAGWMIVPMDTETLNIARVSTDPTISVKAEGTAFAETSILFDSVTLTAHLMGCYILASRELAADAPNFAQLVEQVLSAKIAQQLDTWALSGTGSAQPLGLINGSGINVTDASTGRRSGPTCSMLSGMFGRTTSSRTRLSCRLKASTVCRKR